MAEEPDNLVLEQLRIMRAEMASFRSDTLGEVASLRTSLSQRLTASLGSVLADIQDLKARVARLERA